MEVQNVLEDCTKQTYSKVENLDATTSLREQVEKLKAENNILKTENACQKNDIKFLKEQLHKVQIEKSFLLIVLKTMTSCLDSILDFRITRRSKYCSNHLVQ